jgi:hypothetical protein
MDLEIQLQTCINFLDILTANKGIAYEGYSYGLRCLKRNWLMFQSLFDQDHLFGVWMGYFLDRVFQTFISKLLSYQDESERQLRVHSNSINLLLKQAATLLNHDPMDFTIKALCATGAMALITARIDSNLIRLLGRWQSNAMLRYLHVQAVPVLQNFVHTMHAQGQIPALPDATHFVHHPPP